MFKYLKDRKIPVIFLAVMLLTSLFAATALAASNETKPAIFFQSDNDELKAWLMDKETRVESIPLYPGTVEEGWKIKAVVDMDGNGHSNIYWLHEDGRLKVWLMEGLKKVDTVYPLNPATGEPQISPAWEMMAVYDLNDSGVCW